MPLTFQCMEFAVVNGRQKLVKNMPLLRMSKDGQEVFIQNGQLFSRGTDRINECPGWVEEEIKKQDKGALDRVGWTGHRKVGRPPQKKDESTGDA